MTNKNTIIMIPARIGSKGIPRKVLRPFNGAPLIFRAIEVALTLKKTIVYINTDSKQIANVVSEKYGNKIKIYFRPKTLGNDEITLDSLAIDFVKENNFIDEILITIQPTSPLLEAQTLLNLVTEFSESSFETLLTVSESRKLEWVKLKDGNFKKKYKNRVNRQFIEPSYTETGAVVICHAKNLLLYKSRFGNTVKCVEVSTNESIDIDTYSDWIIAEALARGRKLAYITLANEKIGSGHLQRALSIANNFPDFSNEFILFGSDKKWIDMIKSTNYKYYVAKDKNDAFRIAKDLNVNLLLLDMLNTDEIDLKTLRAHKIDLKIASFEDLGEGSVYTDITINELYPSVSEGNNHIYNGPKYSFFRDEFIGLAEISWENREYDLIISFGGTDPNNLTMRVLNVIEDIKEALNIRAILGLGAKRLQGDLTKHSLNSHHKINDSESTGNISNEWMQSRYGICGGGRTVYEFMVCDLNTTVLCQNSRELTHLYSSKVNGVNNLGVHSDTSDHEILKAIKSMDFFALSNPSTKVKIKPNKTNGRVIKLLRNLLGSSNV